MPVEEEEVLKRCNFFKTMLRKFIFHIIKSIDKQSKKV